MQQYRYPASTLMPDYLRVGVGLAVTAGPLLALELAPAVAILLAALALLFAWFGVRTALRQAGCVELSPGEIALSGPVRRRLRWQHLRRLQVAYYAPRRARRDGWLQLTLRGPAGAPIRVDSTLDGFEEVLRRAIAAAAANQVALDPTTEANLMALGIASSPAPDRSPAGKVSLRLSTQDRSSPTALIAFPVGPVARPEGLDEGADRQRSSDATEQQPWTGRSPANRP